MTDAQKKAVTEWLGECWLDCYERERAYECGRRSQNRDFTTTQDFMACFDRLRELGQWRDFRYWIHFMWTNTPLAIEHDEFDIWYHGKLPDGTWRLFGLIAEWLEKGEENE